MAEAAIQSSRMTRREFLYYIWAASMAIITLEFTGLFIWFAIPRFRAGEFGGLFPFDMAGLPEINDPPVNVAEGRFWLVNLDGAEANELMYQAPDEEQAIRGVAAIYKVCTHLGCIYAWNAANSRFECPCHGSKYRLDGRRIEDPAPRTLDRFKIIAVDDAGNELASSSENSDGFYQPLIIPEGTAQLQIDTGARRDGPSAALLCDIQFGYC